jgi:hypothetical protein
VLGEPRWPLAVRSAALAGFFWLGLVAQAEAIPVFAHRYGLTCQACHTVVPHLTAFGEAFRAGGYYLPGLKASGAFPVAIRFQSAYASNGTDPLPKTIVDEVEFLTGGSIGKRVSYWLEQYAVDGGLPGRTREAWLALALSEPKARVPLTLRAGQFTLPLQLDHETFRETNDHYAIWDQTAGDNPFSFFNVKTGVQLGAGRIAAGTSASFALMRGHEPGSGLPSYGLDRQLYVQHAAAGWTASAYRYDGARALDGMLDRFWRQGYGLGYHAGRAEIDAIYQHGRDSSVDPAGDPLVTSGGFVQVRWSWHRRAFAIARWDATQDVVFGRAMTYGAGYALTPSSRVTLYDSLHRDATGREMHTINASSLIAF